MTAAFPIWGERSWLFDKSLQYVVSLDLVYELASPNSVVSTTTRLPMLAVPPIPPEVSTYRIRGANYFKGIDQTEREVPEARVISGNDSISLDDDGAVSLDGRVLLETEASDPISLSYTGVMTLEGGTLQLAGEPKRSINGTAFISSRQEVAVTKYRWLSFNQLIGVGRVEAQPPGDGRTSWRIAMSFDLHLAL